MNAARLFNDENLAGLTVAAAFYLAEMLLSSTTNTLVQQWQQVLLDRTLASCPAT